MNFDELHIFAEIVHCGGITAAADKMGIAKSAVSKHLGRLEQRLQVKLLARSSRRMQLTHEGERLLPRIESLLAESERLLDEAHEELVKPAGAVNIAASPEFGGFVVKHFLPHLLAHYPDLGIIMKLAYSFEDLQNPSIDLAFRISHVNDDRLVAKPLGEFRRIIVASPAYLRSHPLREPADLAKHNCLIFSGSDLRTSWTLQHREQPEQVEHVPVRGNMSVLGFTALLGAVERGAGVASIPDFTAAPLIDQGAIVHCLPSWASPPAPVFIAYRFGAERIGRLKVVIDESRKMLPGLLSG
jgi:DNA-binding transcriptional LysR family regulator